MTLHWWMHWFWVTSLLIIQASIGRSFAAPQSEELQHDNADAELDRRLPERTGRAMYFTKTPLSQTPNTTDNQTEKPQDPPADTITNITTTNTTEEIVHPAIQWTPVNITDVTPNVTQNANATIPTYTNLTETQNATFVSKRRNLTRPDFVKDDGGNVAESRIVTEKPLSLETTFLQTRIPPNIESSRRVIDQGEGGMDTGAIAGISFAALVLTALAGSTAFVLYRRRFSSKHDNSEEMYSLDNDSFLNSLEAMTIQNYWTDTVKHTKL
ncbi:unnamed protein product [Chrysodeixis includens]|uniref:Uncharacterized protein n=1 Tax=Chrysodeixis includens TaxID=689277 RepID=A0A9P0BTP6_CHRIL|nr:unnamed protein product [Chrysodeixis includens]